MKTTDVNIVIIGGGVAGLSAAWSIEQSARENSTKISYALLEGSDRWGGKVCTDEVMVGDKSFVVERGPDSFITQKPWAWQLARKMGLDDQLLPTNDAQRRVFVLNKGRPTTLPDGVMLIVPTKMMPFALSPLISPWGKLRMGSDWFIRPKMDDADETLAQFIRRRLGNEALDKIAEPLLSGIYNADAELQSIMATFPRFRALEQKHGSLIKGMLAAKKMSRRRPAPDATAPRPPSIFVSFRQGMEQFIFALRSGLTGDCRLEAQVQSVRARPAGGYEVILKNGGGEISAETVILATPAYITADLISSIAPQATRQLNQIRYVSTGTISLAYKRATFNHPLNGFGIVIPRSEQRNINAITWTSTKFNHRAPDDHVLLRVFFGGSRTPHMMDVDDDELLTTAQGELTAIMGVDADPLFWRIARWDRSNPQYDVGHLERVAQIEANLPPGLHVTGSPYRGVGIPDCVHQAQQTARSVVEKLISNYE